MKLLVATKQGQGQRKNDFFFCNDGEMVFFGSECSSGSTDDNCGCHRSMCGAESAKATTTMMVAERPAVEYLLAVKTHFEKKWGLIPSSAEMMAESNLIHITKAVDSYPLRTIMERRENGLCPREVKS
jgi:hypothetical protein